MNACVCMYVRMYARVCMYIFLCMCVMCMYVYAYIYSCVCTARYLNTMRSKCGGRDDYKGDFIRWSYEYLSEMITEARVPDGHPGT